MTTQAYNHEKNEPLSNLRRIRRGFVLPFRAAGLLLKNRSIKRYAILPLLCNVFLYVLLVGGAVYYYYTHVPDAFAPPAWNFFWGLGAWLAKALSWILDLASGIIFFIALTGFCYFTFTSVGMVVASPLNDLLSSRVEEVLTGKSSPDADKPLLQSLKETFAKKATYLSIMDSLIIQLKKLACQIIVLPLLLIPFLNIVPLLVQAYWEGVGDLDVGMARNYLRNRHKKPVFKEQRWEIFGLGLAMTLSFMVPLLGLVFMPIGVTAGTMLYCDCDWERVFRENNLTAPENFVVPVVAQKPVAAEKG